MSVWVNTGKGEEFRWRLPWRRDMFEWEEELKQQLFNLFFNAQWKKGELDGWIWDGNGLGTYSVQLGYLVLQEQYHLPQCVWFKVLWALKVQGPTKVCVWRAMTDRLPTRVNLIRRGVNIQNILCPLCLKA